MPQLLSRVKTWHDIRHLNAGLIEDNYTSKKIQPDLVLYGDSLTERLLGRMFGKSGSKMQELLKNTERVFTKEGGGVINGLPLGISSDEVRDSSRSIEHSFPPKKLLSNDLKDSASLVSNTKWRAPIQPATKNILASYWDERCPNGLLCRRYRSWKHPNHSTTSTICNKHATCHQFTSTPRHSILDIASQCDLANSEYGQSTIVVLCSFHTWCFVC